MNFLQSLQSFNILDIIFVTIFAIFAVYGLIQGFFKQVAGFLSGIISVILAFLLCGKLADFIIANTSWLEKLSAIFSGFLNNKLNVDVSYENISATINNLGVPQFIGNIILKYAENFDGQTINLLAISSEALSRLVIVVATFILIFIVTKILCLVVGKVGNLLINKTPAKWFNKLLGFLIGCIKGFFLVYNIILLITILPLDGYESLSNLINQSAIIAFFVNNHLFDIFINKI